MENACIHGIEGTSNDGVVEVLFEIRSNELYISIRDTGVGMDQDKLASLHKMMQDPSMDRMSELSKDWYDECIYSVADVF